MNTEQLAERIATALESINEIQTININKIIALEENLSELNDIVSDNTSDIEEIQLGIDNVNVLTCIAELQQIVADLKQEPVGMLFTPVG